jgi:hypothetical protein
MLNSIVGVMFKIIKQITSPIDVFYGYIKILKNNEVNWKSYHDN